MVCSIFKNLYFRSRLYSYMKQELKSPQIGNSTHSFLYVVSLILCSYVVLTRLPVSFILPGAKPLLSPSYSHYIISFCLFIFCTGLWRPLRWRLSLVCLYHQEKQQTWLLSTLLSKGIRRGMGLGSSRCSNICWVLIGGHRCNISEQVAREAEGQ